MRLEDAGEVFALAIGGRFHDAGKTGQELRERVVTVGIITGTLLTPPGVTDGVSVQQDYLTLTHHGIVGDVHYGPGKVGKHDDLLRVMGGHPKGAPRRNNRQITMVGVLDFWRIAEEMGLPGGDIPPGLLGENLRIEGVNTDFTHTPASYAVVYDPDGNPRRVTLSISGINRPCGGPHAAIARHFGMSFLPNKQFRRVAEGHRGVIAEVLTPGPADPHETGCTDDPTAEIHPEDRVIFFT
ncbi:MAG TPA: hypothetical protein VLA88_04080 [Candidatus Saccharimonadales bacterium]|nr:hypothetical protein [Candidatus Saccharimonadales bacterium]